MQFQILVLNEQNFQFLIESIEYIQHSHDNADNLIMQTPGFLSCYLATKVLEKSRAITPHFRRIFMHCYIPLHILSAVHKSLVLYSFLLHWKSLSAHFHSPHMPVSSQSWCPEDSWHQSPDAEKSKQEHPVMFLDPMPFDAVQCKQSVVVSWTRLEWSTVWSWFLEMIVDNN